jgi:putative aminopeptidase FrvX
MCAVIGTGVKRGVSIEAQAGRLVRHPAVPYFEAAVCAEAIRICDEHGLDWRLDRFGNLLVTLRTASRTRPLALAAHLDHPGFHVGRRGGKWITEFHGGVADEYFGQATPLRVLPGGWAARLGRRLGKERRFQLDGTVPAGATPEFAVWELEDFAVRGDCIHGRACDDLIGCAAILATLIELKRCRARVHVIGVLARAEEVGFHGALMVARSRALPKDALVVSLETSRELPPVQMGQGVIVRVGDRASVFDSRATRFLTEVAGEVRREQPDFRFQRALMSGGTCEGTAYQEHGFQTAALCVALGNYHNCAAAGRIAAEYVSTRDARDMVRLLVGAARAMPRFAELTGRLPKRLATFAREARRRLRP